MVSENIPVDCRNWCWNWHWSRTKLQLRDLLTLASFYLLAWFCCLPPPATTSGKWRKSGHRLVWLPNKWPSGTHVTAQWWVLPTRQFWDSLVESPRQEWVRRVCGCRPAFEVRWEQRKHWGDLSCFSQHEHCTQRRREHRQKEEEGRSRWGVSSHFSEVAGRQLLAVLAPCTSSSFPGTQTHLKCSWSFPWTPTVWEMGNLFHKKHNCSWVFNWDWRYIPWWRASFWWKEKACRDGTNWWWQ